MEGGEEGGEDGKKRPITPLKFTPTSHTISPYNMGIKLNLCFLATLTQDPSRVVLPPAPMVNHTIREVL